MFPGEPCAGTSWTEGIRGGDEEFAGAPDGGGKVGQFLGLGSRVVCGEDMGAAVADATAVDMVEFLSTVGLLYIFFFGKLFVIFPRDQRREIPQARSGASMGFFGSGARRRG